MGRIFLSALGAGISGDYGMIELNIDEKYSLSQLAQAFCFCLLFCSVSQFLKIAFTN